MESLHYSYLEPTTEPAAFETAQPETPVAGQSADFLDVTPTPVDPLGVERDRLNAERIAKVLTAADRMGLRSRPLVLPEHASAAVIPKDVPEHRVLLTPVVGKSKEGPWSGWAPSRKKLTTSSIGVDGLAAVSSQRLSRRAVNRTPDPMASSYWVWQRP